VLVLIVWCISCIWLCPYPHGFCYPVWIYGLWIKLQITNYSPASKVKQKNKKQKKKKECTHSTTNTNKITTQQDNYKNTHGQPTTITHKTTKN